jgi:uncharacterized protein involved in exopolysaccharide biosynthesis
MAISDNDRHDAYLRRLQLPVPDVEGFVEMLRRRAAFIVIVTLACAAMSLAYILVTPPRFVASGQLLLDPPLPQPVGSDSAARGTAVDSTVEDESPINVMTSRSLLEKVIAREKLETDPLFGAKSGGILAALLTGVGLAPEADPNARALRQLNRAISVTHTPGVSVANIDVTTSDPETSARVANAVMDSYIEQETRERAATTRRVAPPPDARVDLLQARLREAEQRYEAFRRDSGTAIAAGQAAIEKQANELPGRIADAETKVTVLRSALTQMQRASDQRDFRAIPESLRTETLNALKSRYLAAQRLEADLSDAVGRSAELRYARQQMAEVTRLLDQAIEDGVQSTAAELERARTTVTQLKSQLEASKKVQNSFTETSARLRELERDVEASRANYQAILTQSRVSGEQRQLDNENPRIVTRATPPPERSGAPPTRILLINLLLGLGFAISLAWLLELISERNGKAARL